MALSYKGFWYHMRPVALAAPATPKSIGLNSFRTKITFTEV